jgi:glycosyltransferase involved in cell wall biosynthesis
MGGIQTAALGLAISLARRGHHLHLFGPCKNPGHNYGVTFHDRSEFAEFTERLNIDVLIVIPEVLPLLMPVRARARVVWTGNAHKTGDCALETPWTWAADIGARGKRARLYSMAVLHPYCDRIVFKSQWQAQHAGSACGIPSSKITVRYQGVPLAYYGGPAPERHRHRLVYTSQVRRGLEVLLHLFPEVRDAVPEAELHVFDDYETTVASHDLQDAGQPGVHWRGRLSKSQLAHELRSAAIMAYPCNFNETFCTSVAEAQAAGLPVVTSDLAALSERVSHAIDGFLIRGTANEPSYQTDFVEAVIRLLRDDELWTRMGAEGSRKARRLYDWDTIAASWEDELTRLVAGREPRLPGPTLSLLDPSLLKVTEGEVSAHVPATLAREWLCNAWRSFGYDPTDMHWTTS